MEQGALGTAGIRHVWAGAGLLRVVYRGGGILRGFPHSLLDMKRPCLWEKDIDKGAYACLQTSAKPPLEQ